MGHTGEAVVLFFILLSRYGEIGNEAKSPWAMLSVSPSHGQCGILCPGVGRPHWGRGIPRLLLFTLDVVLAKVWRVCT